MMVADLPGYDDRSLIPTYPDVHRDRRRDGSVRSARTGRIPEEEWPPLKSGEGLGGTAG